MFLFIFFLLLLKSTSAEWGSSLFTSASGTLGSGAAGWFLLLTHASNGGWERNVILLQRGRLGVRVITHQTPCRSHRFRPVCTSDPMLPFERQIILAFSSCHDDHSLSLFLPSTSAHLCWIPLYPPPSSTNANASTMGFNPDVMMSPVCVMMVI